METNQDNNCNVFVKIGRSYRLKYTLQDSSIEDVANKLGYTWNLYDFHSDSESNDIQCILFKKFSTDIIGIITKGNVIKVYQRDVKRFVKRYESILKVLGSYLIENSLNQGIEDKNYSLPFLAERMEIDCDTSIENGIFISEKFKYKLFILNGVLVRYESSDGYNVNAKNMQTRNPECFNELYSYAKAYWKDDDDSIKKEVNAHCDACARMNDNHYEHVSEFLDNGIINFKMLMVFYANESIDLQEFENINHGNITYLSSKELTDYGDRRLLALYSCKFGVCYFDELGRLYTCQVFQI